MKPQLAQLAVAIAVVSFAGDARADASSLVDNLGPREVSVGESMRADARGALATRLNPAGLALVRELVFEGGYGYRGDDSASAVSVSACDSTVAVPGCFYYNYFNASPSIMDETMERRSHEVGATFARMLSPRIGVGITTKYFDYNSKLPDEMDSNGFQWDAGLVVRATDYLNIGLTGYNLFGEESAQYPRAVGGGVSARPLGDLYLGFDAVWNLDRPDGEKTGRFGGGAEYFIRAKNGKTGYPLRLGAVHDISDGRTSITGGLGVASEKIGLDVGARKQLDGDDFLITASMRFFGPRHVQGSLQSR